MPIKRHPRRVKTEVVVAVIGVSGVVLAALIGVVPGISNMISGVRSTPSATPVTYNTYDDPTGVFSIDYPSDYSLAGRLIKNTDWLFGFGSLDPDQKADLIQVSLGKDTSTATQLAEKLVARVNQETVNELLTNQNPTTQLISSQRTDKGFRIHYRQEIQGGEVVDYYFIVESAPGLSAAVLIGTGPRSTRKLSAAEIDHILSPFHWSPSAAQQYFP